MVYLHSSKEEEEPSALDKERPSLTENASPTGSEHEYTPTLKLKKNDALQARLGAAHSIDVAHDSHSLSADNSEPSNSTFPVVGMVGSAGGLEAFKSFFAAMPSQCGMAFVLVPHLDANRKSLMVDLLARTDHLSLRFSSGGLVAW